MASKNANNEIFGMLTMNFPIPYSYFDFNSNFILLFTHAHTQPNTMCIYECIGYVIITNDKLTQHGICEQIARIHIHDFDAMIV